MKKLITFLVILALAGGGYYYYTKTTTPLSNQDQEGILRELPAKEVEIFDLGKDIPILKFTKTGTSQSSSIAMVTPQLAGQITNILYKVGDQITKGQTLITLGDSLSTDLIDLQNQASKDAIDLAYETQYLTIQSNVENIEAVRIATKTAKEAYQNAINTKENSYALFDDQRESANLAIESTEEAYEDAEDTLDDLEDDYYDLIDIVGPDDPTARQLESSIEQLENQLDTLELAIDQANLAVQQVENNITLQEDQLNFAVEAAYLSYTSALNQLKSATTGAHLRDLSVESQLIQAETALKSAGLNQDYKNIKAPISGVITEIIAKEGNLTAPGQILAKIENPENITIKTSLNENEAKLLKIGETVRLETGEKGKIISISPTANPISKKIDIEISLDDELSMTPGSFVKIVFYPTPLNKIFVPLNAVHLNDQDKIVKTIIDSKVKNISVETGQIVGDYIEITKGLKGTEKVISSVTEFLEEGDKIKIIENQ